MTPRQTPDAVREAAKNLLIAVQTRNMRGRDHVPSMRAEQDACHRMAKALSSDTAAKANSLAALDSRAGDAGEGLPTINENQAYRLRKAAEAECGCRIPAPFDEVADHVAKVAFDEAVKRCRAAPPAPAVDAVPAGEVERFVIRRNGAFFRPNAQGYTSHIVAAGFYTREEADSYASVEGVTIEPLECYRAEAERTIAEANRLLAALSHGEGRK